MTVVVFSADSPSDETLNRGPLAQLLGQQYEFPFGINIVQFSFFFFFNFQFFDSLKHTPLLFPKQCSFSSTGMF